jgi:CBS domain-containing protein
MTVRQVLDEKSRAGLWTIGPRASVYEALHLMATENIGALIVAEGGIVRGLISERDYARKVILIGKTAHETTVAEIMSAPAVTVSLETTVSECMALMTGRRIRHLPVVDYGKLVGCVSIGDIVKSIIGAQERLLREYETYVTGSYPV